jgi:hypothetical protein
MKKRIFVNIGFAILLSSFILALSGMAVTAQSYPVGGNKPAPADQIMVLDTTENYLGGCLLTDVSEWKQDTDLNVTMVQFWYNWAQNETTLDFTITKDGEQFLSGTAERGQCDPYQQQWCNANFVIEKTFPSGNYFAKVAKASMCLKPGDTGTVRLYGPVAPVLVEPAINDEQPEVVQEAQKTQPEPVILPIKETNEPECGKGLTTTLVVILIASNLGWLWWVKKIK